MMNSRKRVDLALNHQEPDRIPLDLGGCIATGMHVSAVYRLRQALGLDPPGTPVKIIDTFSLPWVAWRFVLLPLLFWVSHDTSLFTDFAPSFLILFFF